MAPSTRLQQRQLGEEHESISEEKILREIEAGNPTDGQSGVTLPERRVEQPLKWGNIVFFSLIHVWAMYSFTFTPYFRWQTWIWTVLIGHVAGFGVTGGVHRLWTHRSYKAKLPLRIFLMIAYATCGMNDIYDWVRDHRIHHKFSETDADPHNAKRGLFFSHIGWLLMKKHPEVIRKGKQVDMNDILNDPVCAYDLKHHMVLLVLLCFFLPTAVPVFFWEESWSCAWAATLIRWVLILNAVWSVNSFAHTHGGRPFNKTISPAENGVIAFWALGEGWHNYHHVFPWDYKTSEHGFINTTMHLIRFTHALGLAFDLKSASPDLIKRVVQRYGDGTHPDWAHSVPEVPEEAAEDVTLVNKLTPLAEKSID